MRKFFSHGNVNELVERNALTLRDLLGHLANRWHESERKFTHDDLLLVCGHGLPLFFNSLSSSAGVSTRYETVWRHHGILPAAKILGIEGIGWHTFRHTYATLLKANGEDVKTVQELLRHANSIVTMNLYAQAITQNKRDAQSRIATMLLDQKLLA